MTAVLLVLAVAIVLAAAWYLSYSAARLDRLHARVGGCWSALEAKLVGRAEAILEVANSGIVDPASALIMASAAADVLAADDAPTDKRVMLEQDVADTINAVLAECVVDFSESRDLDLIDTLVAADRTAQLAARFHNDAVTDVARMRAKPIVRGFRLAGRAAMPAPVHIPPLELSELRAAQP